MTVKAGIETLATKEDIANLKKEQSKRRHHQMDVRFLDWTDKCDAGFYFTICKEMIKA